MPHTPQSRARSPETRAKIAAAMRGNANGRANARITEVQVRELRRRYAAGEGTQSQIAASVGLADIHRILTGKSHGYVPGAIDPRVIARRNVSVGITSWWSMRWHPHVTQASPAGPPLRRMPTRKLPGADRWDMRIW